MSAEQQDPQAPPALPLVKDDRFEEVLALIQGARQRGGAGGQYSVDRFVLAGGSLHWSKAGEG